MDINQLYVHDGTLRGVVEDLDNHILTLLVDLPKDNWSETYIPKRIIFNDVWNYQIHEGACVGRTTILDISEKGNLIRLETTSGYREWEASSYELHDEE